MNQYQDLIVWKKARILVKEIYTLVESFPKSELYWLSDQMRRASISIPSNIAEWNVREGVREQIHFLSIARWSCAEIETQVLLAEDLWFITAEKSQYTQSQIIEISKMLVWLMKNKKNTL